MYWLIEYDPESGLETMEFKYKFLAQKEMKYQFESHLYPGRLHCMGDMSAEIETEIGSFIWEIVGEGNDHDEILKEIEARLGEDYLLSEEMTEFYIEHWHEYECVMDIDSYAYLNTLFSYDIGSDNARQISNWLYEKFNMTTEEIPDGDDADNLMRVAKWDLGLDLDFSNFNADIEEIRYDW